LCGTVGLDEPGERVKEHGAAPDAGEGLCIHFIINPPDACCRVPLDGAPWQHFHPRDPSFPGDGGGGGATGHRHDAEELGVLEVTTEHPFKIEQHLG
jgi:hypothetical protein